MEKKMTAMRLIKWLIIVCICEFICAFILLFSPKVVSGSYSYYYLDLLPHFALSRFALMRFALVFMCLVNMAACITGVILFGYLCCTRRLAISRKVFFLLPYVLLWFVILRYFGDDSFSRFIGCFTKWPWSIDDMYSLYYVIVTCGLPFLLYCFLQITEGRLAVAAKILCFILPLLVFAVALDIIQT
jgi:hypothetical protein